MMAIVRRFALVTGFVGVLCVGAALSASPALSLVGDRVFEMVSPPFKGGYDVYDVEAVAVGGEHAFYTSQGAFVGIEAQKSVNMYLATRTPSGWTSVPREPPSSLLPMSAASLESGVTDITPTLTSLAGGLIGPNAGQAQTESGEEALFALPGGEADSSGGWRQLGPVLRTVSGTQPSATYESGSPDLCQLLLREQGTALLTKAVGSHATLYDVSAGCGPQESGLALVALNNKNGLLNPACEEVLGGYGHKGFGSQLNAVGDAGQEVFFTDYANRNDLSGACTSRGLANDVNPVQVFVRLAGEKTLEISRPLGPCNEVPCPGATERAFAQFQGADEAGTRVFFTTAAPLAPATDKDAGTDLYMAEVGCPGGTECAVAERQVSGLTQVSRARAGEAANVISVVRMAPDGSFVYFVAQGVLDEQAGADGATATAGADNLYVFDSAAGTTRFIANLCSGSGVSGEVADPRCPTDLEAEGPTAVRNDGSLWREESIGSREAQVAGPQGADGQFLLFSTYGRLIEHGPETDADDAKDVYRYDAATGALNRISLGVGGYGALGNCDEGSAATSCDATFGGRIVTAGLLHVQDGMELRAMSEDGVRVVFESRQALSSDASNGLTNIYEWLQSPDGSATGAVAMVSTGSAPVSDRDAVLSPNGTDLFFVSAQGLLPQDTDGQADVYDARLHGGFQETSVPVEPCAADACRGALSTPAPILIPTSTVEPPEGNRAAPKPPSRAKARGKKTPRRHRRAKRKVGHRRTRK